MRTRYLVCYDIADPGRWYRIYRVLLERGEHLQYSVFLCSLSWPELVELKDRLAALIQAREDDVRLYALPSGATIETLGASTLAPQGVDLMIEGRVLTNPDDPNAL
ncbi:MAG: CRISPR-associated endonuclease Cas2 [Nitrospirae bacterium]|nr:MAG: CRISPR-associated endonuclease Cas2 [Nitrospirota bacterium]